MNLREGRLMVETIEKLNRATALDWDYEDAEEGAYYWTEIVSVVVNEEGDRSETSLRVLFNAGEVCVVLVSEGGGNLVWLPLANGSADLLVDVLDNAMGQITASTNTYYHNQDRTECPICGSTDE